MRNRETEKLAGLLTKVGSYKEVIGIIVQQSLEIIGSDRSCLVIKTSDNRFRVEAGIPEATHGIGTILSKENGEDFFNDLIAGGCHELIKDLSKVSYMAGHIKEYNITSLLVVPLFHHCQPMGVLVLDFVCGHEISDEKLSQVKSLGHFAALAIWLEQHKREMREKSKFFLMAQNTAEVAHDTKNSLQKALGFSDLALENLIDLINSPRKTKKAMEVIVANMKKSRESIKISVDYFNQIKNGMNPKESKFQTVNINEFLEDEIITLSKCWPKMSFHFDFDNDGLTVEIDAESMSNFHDNLVSNALMANAGNFTVKTKALEDQKVAIFYINDGDTIDPAVLDKIFDPFETTKADGWGVGLVIAKNIIERIHGGKIKPENIQDGVMFTVTLPIKQ